VQTQGAAARATPDIIAEILDVLLDNAHRHGAGTVTLTLRAVDTSFAIEVRDEGEGVADPERAFERREPRSAGHGIGLALARSLAHADGGRLVLTMPGPRPVFTLLLPSAESA
jgi:signal transduction histidine kinase